MHPAPAGVNDPMAAQNEFVQHMANPPMNSAEVALQQETHAVVHDTPAVGEVNYLVLETEMKSLRLYSSIV